MTKHYCKHYDYLPYVANDLLSPCAYCKDNAELRLEYLRQELRAERISYAELAELQSLAPYIDAGDVELLEAAGVPEFTA